MSRAIALVGLRCVGKTSVGRELAGRLGRKFVDLDEVTVEVARERGSGARDVAELFRGVPREEFRAIEEAALERALASDRIVLATGGGAVESARSRALLRERARVVWLKAPLELLAKRLAADTTARPALDGVDAVLELPEVARRREPFYTEVAEFVLDCGRDPPARIARRLVEALAKDSDAGPSRRTPDTPSGASGAGTGSRGP